MAFLVCSLATPCDAEDWGVYRIISASTPEFVLEAVGDLIEGAVSSIQKPGNSANPKWIITPTENSVRISPSQDSSLVLSVEKGGAQNGALIVLEKDRGEDHQRWTMVKHENGSYSLLAKHAPDLGLDHNARKRKVGAKNDLWTYSAKDIHLHWCQSAG